MNINNQDHISESLEKTVWVKILKLFDAVPDPGYGIFLTLDPRWKKFGSGMWDELPGFTTLIT